MAEMRLSRGVGYIGWVVAAAAVVTGIEAKGRYPYGVNFLRFLLAAGIIAILSVLGILANKGTRTGV